MELRGCPTWWLHPNTHGERDIVGKVVLEQVCYAVLPAIRMWLLKVGPATLDQAAACLENYVLVEWTGTKPEQRQVHLTPP